MGANRLAIETRLWQLGTGNWRLVSPTAVRCPVAGNGVGAAVHILDAAGVLLIDRQGIVFLIDRPGVVAAGERVSRNQFDVTGGGQVVERLRSLLLVQRVLRNQRAQ